MLRLLTGNLLDAPTEALVNTVNTVGVMGKGIALMFKEAFPGNFAAYAAAAKRGRSASRPACSSRCGMLWTAPGF
jgi:O-acetyl-ADP-ribose deacetylase (regulator of RNase III)